MMAFGACEKGDYREENQDAILIRYRGKSGLFIVADGVGGCAYGAFASKFLTDAFGEWWDHYFLSHRKKTFLELFDEIKTCAERINQELCSRYGAGNSCSTLALLFIHHSIFGILSSGDSRIYWCDRWGVKLVTRDDVWENQPDADEDSVHKGKIISAVGGERELVYACMTDRIYHRTVFLLCSDGIYKFIPDEFLKQNIREINQSLFLKKRALDILTDTAVQGETDDNYSLIAVKI